MSAMTPMRPEEIAAIASQVRATSEFNATSARDLALHFQTLLSARESRLFMEAPGLYFRDVPLLVISKSGINRGHTSIYQSVLPLLPEDRRDCYAFVLYPGSFIRTCMDRVLRHTAKVIAKDMRLSMENVFNRKYHQDSLVDSEVEREIIECISRGI